MPKATPGPSSASSSSPHDEFLSDASPQGDGTFSLEKFYTASADKKGRQTTLNVHLPPSLLRHMQEVVAARKVPEYKTTADMIRDALTVGLHMRMEQIDDPGFSRVNEMTRMDMENQTTLYEWQAEDQAVERLEEMQRQATTPAELDFMQVRIRQALGEVKRAQNVERLSRMKR